MHSSMGYHQTIIERVRAFLDAPAQEAKENDAYLLAHAVAPAMTEIWGKLNLNSNIRIINRLPITLVVGQPAYVLPPCVLKAHRLVTIDDEGHINEDFRPESDMNPDGPSWSIQGNELYVRPYPTSVIENLELHYISSGDVLTHYSSSGGTLAADKRDFILGTPSLGQKDRRESSYVGQILRLLPASPGTIEERIIAYHDVSTDTVITRRPFVDATAGANKVYEIAPMGSQVLYDAVAARAAYRIGIRLNKAVREAILQEYRSAMTAIGNNMTHIMSRNPDGWIKNTVDAEEGIGFVL